MLSPSRTVKVLVVEDHVSLRSSLARVLAEHGFDVLQAMDGQAALDLLENERADLMVADIFMPGIDGLQLLAHAHVQNENMRVILISAASFDGIAEAAMRLGVDAFLPKPFLPAELVSAVERVLGERVPRQASPPQPI